MTRKGENIYKRKDGRWEGRYIKGRNGKKAIYGYIYAKSYAEAKRLLLSKKLEISIVKNPSSSLQKDILFNDIANDWLVFEKVKIKESTWVKYRNILNNHVIPYIGNNNISTVDYYMVSELSKKLLVGGNKHNKPLSSKTVADVLSVIKGIIKYANSLKYPTDLSVLAVSINIKSMPLRVLTIQEQQVLINHIIENMDLTGLGILLSLFTGIRLGELCALTWDDISLESNIIYVHQTIQRLQTPNGETKTAVFITVPKSQCSIRNIPINPALREYLINQPIKQGYVLTGCNKYIEPRTLQYRFASIMKSLEIKGVHFHTLRHTFATRCIEVGFDLKSLSEILGHSNVNITLNRYVHPSIDLKQKNMNKLSELFPSTK